MKIILGALVLSLCIIAPMQALAEAIPHHGMSVDADFSPENCISCHDGSVATIVSFCTVKCDFKSSHSLFKPYPPLKRNDEFAPVAAVMVKGIKFQNGQITCVSCHNLRSTAAKHLIMENTGSALCRTCHLRK